jgi:hypothetical protein
MPSFIEALRKANVGTVMTDSGISKPPIAMTVAAVALYRSSKRLEKLSVILVALTVILAILTAVLILRTFVPYPT